jgi:bifunctional DNase/RNase
VIVLRTAGVRHRRRVVQRWLPLVGMLAMVGCTRGRSGEVEVEVSRVAIDPASRSPVVVLEDKDHKMALPIWIGPAEAQAIASRLEGIETPRPLTHDLMKNVLDRIGVGLRKVVIRDLRENTYYAHIVLDWDGEEVTIDSRPSDAIALAVRFGQPIFVSRALMERESIVARSGSSGDALTVGGITVQVLSEELAGHFDLPHGQGVVVSDVAAGEHDGLRRGDVILEVDGRPVRDPEDFRAQVTAQSRATDLAVHRNGSRIHVAFAVD